MSVTRKDYTDHLELFTEQLVEVFNHQESGVKAQHCDLRLFETFLIENEITHIDTNTILQFIVYVRKERKNSPESTNRKLSSIKTYLRYLRFSSVQGAFDIKTDDIKCVRSAYQGPLQTLNHKDIKLIFEQIDMDSRMGFRDFVIVSLMYRLGLRVGEVHRLSLDDINMEDELITVHGKGKKMRVLPLVDDMPELIAKAIVIQNSWYGANRNDALFLSRKGHRLGIRTIQENFKKLVKAAGELSIQKVTPHTLRHAFASHVMEKEGADLIVLKAIMGHKYLSTLEIYMHPSIEAQRRAVNDHIANEVLGGAAANVICFSRFQPKRIHAN